MGRIANDVSTALYSKQTPEAKERLVERVHALENRNRKLRRALKKAVSALTLAKAYSELGADRAKDLHEMISDRVESLR